jgi:hypothetical protein
MGHVRDTYTQIRNLDIDFLRNKYLSANLRIREAKTDERQLKELLKNIVRQYGYDPERFIVPGATIVSEDAVGRALARFIFGDEEKNDKNSSGDSFMVLKMILEYLLKQLRHRGLD